MQRLNQSRRTPSVEIMNLVLIKYYCLYSHISHFYLFSGAKVGKKEIERNLRRAKVGKKEIERNLRQLMFFTILTYDIKFACPLWRVFATGSRRNVRG